MEFLPYRKRYEGVGCCVLAAQLACLPMLAAREADAKPANDQAGRRQGERSNAGGHADRIDAARRRTWQRAIRHPTF